MSDNTFEAPLAGEPNSTVRPQHFDYRTEPFLGPLIAAVVFILVALVVPITLFRLLLLGTAAGPGVWAFVQWRRQGRGVRIEADELAIQPWLIGRQRVIPFKVIQNYFATDKGQFVVAFRKPDPAPATGKLSDAALQSRYPALTELRPESHRRGPRYSLTVTSALADAGGLVAALDSFGVRPADAHFEHGDMAAWYARHRLRNILLFVLVVLGTPIYVVIIGRIIGSFIAMGVNASGR